MKVFLFCDRMRWNFLPFSVIPLATRRRRSLCFTRQALNCAPRSTLSCAHSRDDFTDTTKATGHWLTHLVPVEFGDELQLLGFFVDWDEVVALYHFQGKVLSFLWRTKRQTTNYWSWNSFWSRKSKSFGSSIRDPKVDDYTARQLSILLKRANRPRAIGFSPSLTAGSCADRSYLQKRRLKSSATRSARYSKHGISVALLLFLSLAADHADGQVGDRRDFANQDGISRASRTHQGRRLQRRRGRRNSCHPQEDSRLPAEAAAGRDNQA